MEEAVPPALVLGCNTPHGIGVLSDWIEERTGHAPDFHERLTGGTSYGLALVHQRFVCAGVRAGDSLRSAHDASRDASAADATGGGRDETNRKECSEVSTQVKSDDEHKRYRDLVNGSGKGFEMWFAAYTNNPDRNPEPILAFAEWLERNDYPLYGAMTRKHAEDYRVEQLKIPEAT